MQGLNRSINFVIARMEKISLLFLKGKIKNKFKFFKGEW